jgi:hypothetical protein
MYAQDEVPGEEVPGEPDPFAGEEEFGEEEPEMEGVIEINGVKYAPVVSEDEMFEGTRPGEQPEPDGYGPDVNEDKDLDLESVIKELESELDEDDDLDESDNPYDNNEQHNDYKKVSESTEFEIDESLFEEDGETMDEEVDETSGIGGGDNVKGKTDKTSGIGTANTKLKESRQSMRNTRRELKEYKEAVQFLKSKLHEVNILNAKLLFTNKLFKEFSLSNDQKMKVVENFDRAQTTREIKLVFSTLAESFKQNNSIRRKSINENASAKSGSTKPSRKVITETNAIADRFKKLANIN